MHSNVFLLVCLFRLYLSIYPIYMCVHIYIYMSGGFCSFPKPSVAFSCSIPDLARLIKNL